MATIKGNKQKETPGISTASLPDIIFILLFFFMVATVMRTSDQLVRTSVPAASELTKIENKSLVSTIFVGPPNEDLIPTLGDAPRIQLNDKITPKEGIVEWVESERLRTEERYKNKKIFALKVDGEVKLGIVADIKWELRRAGALKIQYNASQRGSL